MLILIALINLVTFKTHETTYNMDVFTRRGVGGPSELEWNSFVQGSFGSKIK